MENDRSECNVILAFCLQKTTAKTLRWKIRNYRVEFTKANINVRTEAENEY